jgi:diguanylate cyclase (GGDEF)-like protein
MDKLGYRKKDCLAELNRLTSIVRKLSLSQNIEEISEIVLKEARDIAKSNGATFVLKEKDVCHYLDENSDFPLWKGQQFPIDKCICGVAMNQGFPLSIKDVALDSRIPMESYRTTLVKSLLITPILPSNSIGAIGNYWSEEHQPNEDTIHLLQTLSDLTAIAIEKNRLHVDLEKLVKERTSQLEHEIAERKKVQEALMQLSLTDSLTGILNRRGFFFQVEQEIKLSSRLKTHSILMFADVDGLKKVNDTYGHAAGDEMIINAANVLRSVFRSSDVISRLGGDEFAAFTMETTDAEFIRSRIIKAIHDFNSTHNYPYTLSISIGFVELEAHPSVCLDDLVKRADEAMYEDKQAKKGKRRLKIKQIQKIIADSSSSH